MMKILRLRAYCYPENVAASAMGDDIDEGFAKNGIVSVNYTPVPSRGISDEVRKEYKHKKYEEFKNGNVIVHRFSMIKEGPGVARKALRYLLCAIVEYFKGVKEQDIDALFGYSTPMQGVLCAKVAQKLSKKYGRKVPFVYNLQDIFPDSLVNARMTKKGSLIWKIGRKIEDYTYRAADRIIVISEDFKKNIMEKGVPENKIVVIPNWGDTDGIYPVERNSNILFDKYNLDREKFYICYCGTIGYSQNLGLLLDVAKEIKGEQQDVRFVVIGDGAAKPDFEKRIKDESIDNVIVLPFQPYENMACAFSLGDVGLVICKPGVGGAAVPSKTWNIMAAEKPILASFDRKNGLSALIEAVGCGVVADAGNKEELIEAIRGLVDDTRLAEKGWLGREYLLTELNKEKCVGKYVETFLTVGINDN